MALKRASLYLRALKCTFTILSQQCFKLLQITQLISVLPIDCNVF